MSRAAPASLDSTPSINRDVLAGALAGQIAGLVMAVAVMAVFTVFLGKSPLYPVQVIGSFVFGDAALAGFHLGALLAGLVLHQLGPSLFWGGVFGAIAGRLELRSRLALAVTGLAIGAVSQLLDVHVVLPIVMKALHGHDLWAEQVPVVWSWIAHLVFGLALVTFPWCTRWLDERL
ncbi:MAG: hypothetical protein H6709_02065 [Kofleriaceae bacterium]|nr:hypothetical protein [Myxococcales bacterium]MCA9857332.1 hypothetical protein [Dehalococcoidia bacterium]MCB9570856.1 hypothetical protein [Kofleriaceae bacterium]